MHDADHLQPRFLCSIYAHSPGPSCGPASSCVRCRLSSCTAPAACFYESNLTIPTYLALTLVASVVGGIGYLGTATDTTSLNDALYLMSLSPPLPKVNTILSVVDLPQPATPIFTDNACAVGLDTVKVKRRWSIDMHFHWIRDRIKENQFSISWIPGTTNLADFFTLEALPGTHEARSLHATPFCRPLRFLSLPPSHRLPP